MIKFQSQEIPSLIHSTNIFSYMPGTLLVSWNDEQQSLLRVFTSGFPDGSLVKNLPANSGSMCLIPDLGRYHIALTFFSEQKSFTGGNGTFNRFIFYTKVWFTFDI